MLCAAEVLIAGIGIYALRQTGNVLGGFGLHHLDYVAPSFAPIDAGAAPVVTIDDVDSHVIVTPSKDGLVHVNDQTVVHGYLLGGTEAQRLAVTRTRNGVRITRPEGHTVFGESYNRLVIALPSMSRVTITRSNGDDISAMHSGVDVTSQDGHISLDDVRGTIHAHSNNGRITATDLLPSASSFVDLSTNDGRISISLAPQANVTVDASTNDGHIYLDGSRWHRDRIRIRDGSAPMHLRTEDGSIRIMTNGAT